MGTISAYFLRPVIIRGVRVTGWFINLHVCMYCRRRSQPLSDYQTARPAETNRYHVPLWTLTKLDKGTRCLSSMGTEGDMTGKRISSPCVLIAYIYCPTVHYTHNSRHTNCATPAHYKSIKMHSNDLICKGQIYLSYIYIYTNYFQINQIIYFR